MIRKLFIANLVFIFILIIGCSGASVDPEPEEPEDHITGIYFLEGTKIINRTLYPQGYFISTDTTSVTFTIYLDLLDPNENQIQIFGLRGLNAGDLQVLPSDCGQSTRDCAIVSMEDSRFDFNFRSPNGIYNGTGELADGQIEIDTYCYYRGREFLYDLSGSKID